MATTTLLLSEGQYLKDILEQGAALQRTLDMPLPDGFPGMRRALQRGESPFVILTGMGSSFHALRALSVRLAADGIRPLLLETSELIYYYSDLLTAGTTVIAVSQSGRSAEMIRLLEVNAGRASILSVTNDADSPLALGSECVVLIDAGPEATVSCKTYTCTLLALSLIGELLCGGDMDAWTVAARAIPNQVEQYLQRWKDHVAQLIDLLGETEQMILVGRGPSLATAGTGGLIIKEAARFHAEGMSAAAFRHGPFEMISDRLFVLAFSGDARSAQLNAKMVADVEITGGRSALVDEHSSQAVFRIPPTIDSLRPILECFRYR